jgi:hypothetical protein
MEMTHRHLSTRMLGLCIAQAVARLGIGGGVCGMAMLGFRPSRSCRRRAPTKLLLHISTNYYRNTYAI